MSLLCHQGHCSLTWLRFREHKWCVSVCVCVCVCVCDPKAVAILNCCRYLNSMALLGKGVRSPVGNRCFHSALFHDVEGTVNHFCVGPCCQPLWSIASMSNGR